MLEQMNGNGRSGEEQNEAAEQVFKEGFCCATGQGVAVDMERAMELYLQASGMGHREAQCMAGYLLLHGECVEQDCARGAELLRQSAEQGHALGQYWYGKCLVEGNGVEQNEAEGNEYLERSAKQGNTLAVEELNKRSKC